MDELNEADAVKKAAYQEIKGDVLEHSNIIASCLYLAQVKQKYSFIERENYNKPKPADHTQTQCPPDREKVIKGALALLGIISFEFVA